MIVTDSRITNGKTLQLVSTCFFPAVGKVDDNYERLRTVIGRRHET